MSGLSFKPVPHKEHEELNIKSDEIKAGLKVYTYIDKDTNQYIAYIPSLEISGYGTTKQESQEMLHFSLEEYFDYLLSLQKIKMQQELSALGWKHSKHKDKQYSKVYIDKKGDLKGFALRESVEEEMLAV